MKAFLTDPRHGPLILGGSSDSPATTMILEPGEVEDSAGDRHAPTDQWLLVLSGTGQAAVRGMRLRLTAGLLLMIAATEAHQIRNTGGQRLVTLKLAAPPLY